jgi:hypothetical protein
MIIFLISSSYFINFLGIYLSLEKGFIALCVQLQGVPSNYLSVPHAMCVCVPMTGGVGVLAWAPNMQACLVLWSGTGG